MKVLPFKIPKTGHPAILTQVDSGPFFYDILHKHPEYQITLIVRGTGTLICGEYLGRFEPGDVIMFGPNQPHVLKSDEEYYKSHEENGVHAISIFFMAEVLGSGFLGLDEAAELQSFLDNGKSGFKFSKAASYQAARGLEQASKHQNLDLIIQFLQVLRCLMIDKEAERFGGQQRSMNDNEGQRMKEVMQYTLRNFRSKITINEIADIANMTPNAFCKYFKSRTRKTYLNYLNELRISYACRQLRGQNPSVSQVAHLSGFSNLAHFNTCFKKLMGVTPGKYGRSMQTARKR